MRIEVWSDVVCPWCYIGKRHLEVALERFAHGGEVEVSWRSFELDPGAPSERGGSYVQHLADKYGTSRAGAQAMIDQMTAKGAQAGLDFHFERARPGNTFDAHRLLHHAAELGRQGALKERLLRAAFSEGAPVGDRATLARLAGEVGLDPVAAREVLDSDAYAEAVRDDERRARALGGDAVPFFVVDGRYGVVGAQPAEVLLQVVEKAWAEQAPALLRGGEACQGGSCQT